MSHDAKAGSRPRYDRALRALAAAQRREAAACDRFADLIDAASLAAVERSRALSDGAKASARLAGAFEDREEANRTHRQAELMLQQSGQAKAESAATQTRAKASRAEANRARAQAATNDSFAVTRPRSRAVRRGG